MHNNTLVTAASTSGLARASARRQGGNIYIYIYIYTYDGSVRFVSVPDFSKINRFGSVRFGSEMYFSRFDAVQLAFFGHAVARSGSVRFGSVPRPVLAGSGIKRFGSAGSVRFLIPSCQWCRKDRAEEPVACTVSKQYARKRASRSHTYSATPSCAIIHAQAHAPVPHPCVLYPCDDNNDNDIYFITGRTRFDSFRF